MLRPPRGARIGAAYADAEADTARCRRRRCKTRSLYHFDAKPVNPKALRPQTTQTNPKRSTPKTLRRNLAPLAFKT